MHGAGQRFRTQTERTAATSLFARTMLSLPFLLGYDYFMWVDEPALGISTPFPEDSNYGLINEDGAPYPQLTSMFAALQREAGTWRFRPAPAPRQLPSKGPVPDPMALARAAAVGGAKAFFVREGNTFRAGNGVIELSGALGDGDLVRRVSLAGIPQPIGQYNALIQTLNAAAQNRWSDTKTLKAVDGHETDGVAVVELTGATHEGEESFEVTHRLMLPAGVPWFVSQVISVKNTGRTPLKLKALFFRLYSDFKRAPEKLPPNLWGLPTAGCWLDGQKDGRFWGTVASTRSDIQIYFWVGETGADAHPDARQEVDETEIAPGAVYTPPEPVYVLCTAGVGGDAAWLNRAQELGALIGR